MDSSGAKSQVAGIVSAIVVMFVLLFLTPVFKNMPQNVQGAIVISAVLGLFNYSEWFFLWKVGSRLDSFSSLLLLLCCACCCCCCLASLLLLLPLLLLLLLLCLLLVCFFPLLLLLARLAATDVWPDAGAAVLLSAGLLTAVLHDPSAAHLPAAPASAIPCRLLYLVVNMPCVVNYALLCFALWDAAAHASQTAAW